MHTGPAPVNLMGECLTPTACNYFFHSFTKFPYYNVIAEIL